MLRIKIKLQICLRNKGMEVTFMCSRNAPTRPDSGLFQTCLSFAAVAIVAKYLLSVLTLLKFGLEFGQQC